MSVVQDRRARAVADVAAGRIFATVDVAASPERVFQALASKEITNWWVRPGVFDTREWTGEVRAGGQWRASGAGIRGTYVLEGEFLEVEPPRTLTHTWHFAGTPDEPTTVTYALEPIAEGTRITLRHSGFVSPEACQRTALSWETSFERLSELFAVER